MRIQRNELESTRVLKGFKSKHLNNHFAELSLTVISTVVVSLTSLPRGVFRVVSLTWRFQFARETWLKTNKVVPSRITLISKSLLVSSHLVLDALWLKIPVYTPMFTISSTTSTILSTVRTIPVFFYHTRYHTIIYYTIGTCDNMIFRTWCLCWI